MMAEKNSETNILLFTKQKPLQSQIADFLDAENGLNLTASLTSLQDWEEAILDGGADIVLLDDELDNKNSLHFLEKLALEYPQVAPVVILADEDAKRAQQVLLEGAKSFVSQPIDGSSLIKVLRRVEVLQSRLPHEEGMEKEDPSAVGNLRTYAFFNARGGVGASTLALNLALSLLEDGSKVVLVDGHRYFGHLDMMLNLPTRSSIEDLIPYVAELDRDILNDVVSVHESGLHVLPGSRSLNGADPVNPEALFTILEYLQTNYKYVVVDVGSTLDENAVTLMDSAFRILLVVNPELGSLHNAREFLNISRNLGYVQEKMALVINRADMKNGIKLKQIEQALPLKVLATIPEDTRNALQSINQGLPLNLKFAKSSMVEPIKKLADTLARLSKKELAALRSGDAARREENALERSSRLG